MAILPPTMLTAGQPGCGCSIVVVVVGGTVVVVVGGMVVVAAFGDEDVVDPGPEEGAGLPDGLPEQPASTTTAAPIAETAPRRARQSLMGRVPRFKKSCTGDVYHHCHPELPSSIGYVKV
jgi:hypothetical protein